MIFTFQKQIIDTSVFNIEGKYTSMNTDRLKTYP